jgi:hypothetical protein
LAVRLRGLARYRRFPGPRFRHRLSRDRLSNVNMCARTATSKKFRTGTRSSCWRSATSLLTW